jgi:hypothetical protein
MLERKFGSQGIDGSSLNGQERCKSGDIIRHIALKMT